MKFLCLGYLNAEDFDALTPDQVSEAMADCGKHCESMRAAGTILEEAGLESYRTAKTIRMRKGRQTITDGPFIETKEQLGSFFIVEAESMEDAVRIAAMHPAALLGEEYGWGIEIRALQQYGDA